MPSLIAGTAGHIDHGKTTLVRALTGVDADRLPEEKRRGITIDLGFAELDLGDVRVGFVDVPGHERFVRNMLAGAHGIDLVVLVIAADEGVMPQTREHFDICRLLGVRAGLVVLTKTDAADEELIELVATEAAELVEGSFLEGAPIINVSARTGRGIEELKDALRAAAAAAAPRSSVAVARLPVDRSFTMRGFGSVVTGTLVAGEIREGEEMELLPEGVSVRVRGIQVHGAKVAAALAGRRTAVNLGGIEAAAIERGAVLAEAGRLRPTQVFDARIEVLLNAPRALRSRMRVRVHHGTAEVLARVVVLEDEGEVAPGAKGLVQFRLEAPVVALPSDRFIVRTYSPQQTFAGGVVLDAHAQRHRGRERPAARARLRTLEEGDEAARLSVFIAGAGERGLRRADLAARTGLRDHALDEAIKAALARGLVSQAQGLYVSRELFERMLAAASDEVEAFHLREPLARGIPRETLRERVFARSEPELFRAVVEEAERRGALAAEREIVRAARHSPELTPADSALRDRLESIYTEAGLEPPSLEDALSRAADAGQRREHVRKIFQLLLDAGKLIRVREDLFFARGALDGLTAALKEYASRHEPERLIDVAGFKELSGVSRKYAIPLLEHFDRERITRRAGDRRMIL